MFVRIKSLQVTKKRNEKQLSAPEALSLGRGITLVVETDKEAFLALSVLGDIADSVRTSQPHAEPDTLIFSQKSTEATAAKAETGPRRVSILITPSPGTSDGLYVRFGGMWLSLFMTPVEFAPGASIWPEFCRALLARNQIIEPDFTTSGATMSFHTAGCQEDYQANAGAVLSPEKGIIQYRDRARRGPKPQISAAERIAVVTSEYAKDALIGIVSGKFEPCAGDFAVFTQIGQTKVIVDCDEAIGFGVQKAIERLAAGGADAMQTFLGLMGLWVENNPGAHHETYFTARVTDLMRYMHRKQVANGGYNLDDQIRKGSEVFLLSRVTLSEVEILRDSHGMVQEETFSLDRLLHFQKLTCRRTIGEGNEVQSITEFRYHPNQTFYDMLVGGSPRFAEVSGKLLAYNPVTQKHQIMLGFGLAFYDSACRRTGETKRQIKLGDLLRLIRIAPPERNVDRFLNQIDKAITTLEGDNVIPRVELAIPKARSITTRNQIENAIVTFAAFDPPVHIQTLSLVPPDNRRLL